jgi:hypothetical protein
MAKDEKKTISVNDKTYNIDDLTEQQTTMVNHIADLERKLSTARFNVDQMAVNHQAFVDMLTRSLEGKIENAQEVAAE